MTDLEDLTTRFWSILESSSSEDLQEFLEANADDACRLQQVLNSKNAQGWFPVEHLCETMDARESADIILNMVIAKGGQVTDHCYRAVTRWQDLFRMANILKGLVRSGYFPHSLGDEYTLDYLVTLLTEEEETDLLQELLVEIFQVNQTEAVAITSTQRFAPQTSYQPGGPFERWVQTTAKQASHQTEFLAQFGVEVSKNTKAEEEEEEEEATSAPAASAPQEETPATRTIASSSSSKKQSRFALFSPKPSSSPSVTKNVFTPMFPMGLSSSSLQAVTPRVTSTAATTKTPAPTLNLLKRSLVTPTPSGKTNMANRETKRCKS